MKSQQFLNFVQSRRGWEESARHQAQDKTRQEVLCAVIPMVQFQIRHFQVTPFCFRTYFTIIIKDHTN